MTSTEAGRAASDLRTAELDRRFYAYVIDRAVGWGLGAGVGSVLWFGLGQREPLVVAVAVVGTIVLLSLVFAVLQGTSGATPGKSLLGIRTVRADTGRAPGIGTALNRALILGAAGLPTAGLGLSALAWTAAMDPGYRRRAWHDHVTGTLVVDVRRGGDTDADAEVETPPAMVNLTAMRLMPAPEPPAAQEPLRQGADASATPSTPAPEEAEAHSEAGGVAPQPPPPQPRQPPTRSPEQTAPAPARLSAWRVTFDTGESFVVEGVVLVGRGPEPRAGESVRHVVPLRSADMSLSKTHAQVHVARDGVLVVMDRGSTNGSVLVRRGMSRELAAGRPATLADGDRVRFGDREMLVAREP